MNNEQVILVDEYDNVLGSIDKMEAHQKGLLHRAFSVFIFGRRGEMLLQRRALSKYHSPGLWSNTCCSHPQPGEETMLAAQKRLHEEMGFHTPLVKMFDFIYKVSFENGLTENEFDHVYIGEYNGDIHPNPEEVSDYVFKSMNEIDRELKATPSAYTAWFHIAYRKIAELIQANSSNAN